LNDSSPNHRKSLKHKNSKKLCAFFLKNYAHWFFLCIFAAKFYLIMIRNNISLLRNRELFLFTEEEMNPRQNANRDEVLNVFTPLANIIVAKILEAGDCYLQYAEEHAIARRENTFCSSNMHGLIIEHLAQIEGVQIVQSSKGNSMLEIAGYKVWIKKLGDNGKPSVNETKSSVRRLYQKAEGEDTLPMLILGYQLNDVERVSHIYILYLEGDQHLWAPIDIGDMAASSQTSMITSTTCDEPIVTVKPEKQRGKEAV
jgi:hypothetical protein